MNHTAIDLACMPPAMPCLSRRVRFLIRLQLLSRGTAVRSSLPLGGLAAATIHLADGTGGTARAPGDYVYGDHREPYRDAGLWGLFRVHVPGTPGVRLQRLERP